MNNYRIIFQNKSLPGDRDLYVKVVSAPDSKTTEEIADDIVSNLHQHGSVLPAIAPGGNWVWKRIERTIEGPHALRLFEEGFAKNDPPAPIIPSELATRLNVLQCQMNRHIASGAAVTSNLSVASWARELREIELRLRSIPVVKPDARETDAYFRELAAGAPIRFGPGYWVDKLAEDLCSLKRTTGAYDTIAADVAATVRQLVRSIITEEK